jgi:predicted nucleotidyltransferase component of viral defense system
MAREIRNVGASVRARLLNLARERNSEFQLILTRYSLERLLYRLSLSDHRDRFVLKGAMLFAVWLDDPFRPTRDLDLLGHGNSDTEDIARTFREILSVDVDDDGVIFDVDNIRAEPIRDAEGYDGVRVRTSAAISGARVPVQIDIGFGDAITPAAIETDYPVLLDAPAPHLRAYPKETVIAEKFEALVSLGFVNSRMRDFYDLWTISRTFEFDGAVLTAAIRATFDRRRTDHPAGEPTGLTDEFAHSDEKRTQWGAFIGRERLTMEPPEFPDVVADLREFLMPPMLSGEFQGHWNPGGPWRSIST